MTTGHTHALELLDRSLGYTRVALSTVGPDRSGPSPCAGWSIADLLDHMDDSLDAFLEAAGGAVRVEVPRRRGADVEVLQTKACHLLGVWSGRTPAYVVVGDRPAPTSVIVAAAALEIAVHGWDVAHACGVDRPLPPGLALDLLAVVPLVVRPEDHPHRFAPRVDVPLHARPSTRLLAAVGRHASR